MSADTKQPSADGAAHPPISGWDATDHLSAGEVAMADKIRYDPLSKKWTNRPSPHGQTGLSAQAAAAAAPAAHNRTFAAQLPTGSRATDCAIWPGRGFVSSPGAPVHASATAPLAYDGTRRRRSALWAFSVIGVDSRSRTAARAALLWLGQVRVRA